MIMNHHSLSRSIRAIRALSTLGAVALLPGLSPMSHAQTASTSTNAAFNDADLTADKVAASGAHPEGWDQFLGSSIYGTLNESRDVVGKADGNSTTLGLRLEGAVDYKRDTNELRNRLDLNTSYSRTPIVKEYVKSEDILKLESIYLFHLPAMPYAGPFARANASTAMFDGYDVRPEATTYELKDQDGNLSTETTDRLHLTDPFRPMRLKESLGLFVQPLSRSWATIELRTGLGFRQMLASGQRVIDDVDGTDAIEVRELSDYEKSGLELGLEFDGKTPNKRVSYHLSTDMLIPYYESDKADDDRRSRYERRVVEVDAKVSFHLVEWASIDYLLKSIRDPSVLDKTQLSQTIMFSMNQTLAPRRRG